jgi:hypothetical protein
MRVDCNGLVLTVAGERRQLPVPVEVLDERLGVKATELEGGLGLCPDGERCVPVPASALLERDGQRLVDVMTVAEPLGLVVVGIDDLTVVRPGPLPAVAASGADARGLSLRNLADGELQPLAEEGSRTAVFAWASW